MNALIEQCVRTLGSGVGVGCIYGLMCVGLAFIFGIMRVINREVTGEPVAVHPPEAAFARPVWSKQ